MAFADDFYSTSHARVTNSSRRTRNDGILPKSSGFLQPFENFQNREGNRIYFTARISLPFHVKPDFERLLLGWECTNQIVLFVTLSAPDQHYKKDDGLIILHKSHAPLNPKPVKGTSCKLDI